MFFSFIGETFRMDAGKRKLLQITNFYYFCLEEFWANFLPDRLHELEQLILNKLELPVKLQETYFEDDFCVGVYGEDIQNIEETREARKCVMKTWQQEDIEVRVVVPGWKKKRQEELNKW